MVDRLRAVIIGGFLAEAHPRVINVSGSNFEPSNYAQLVPACWQMSKFRNIRVGLSPGDSLVEHFSSSHGHLCNTSQKSVCQRMLRDSSHKQNLAA